MTAELFPVTESLNPKLVFLQRHGLATFQPAPEWVGMEVPETGEIVPAWFCCRRGEDNRALTGIGDTEADAIVDWCWKNHELHWTVEDRR